jgi:hypothetical protein
LIIWGRFGQPDEKNDLVFIHKQRENIMPQKAKKREPSKDSSKGKKKK